MNLARNLPGRAKSRGRSTRCAESKDTETAARPGLPRPWHLCYDLETYPPRPSLIHDIDRSGD
jgi:hypothetical protein